MTVPLDRWPSRWWPFAVVLAAAAWCWHLSRDPAVVLLRPLPDGARWLRSDRPFDVASHQNVATAVTFAAAVDVPVEVRGARLGVAALRRSSAWVDGQRFDGGPLHLMPGPHLLRVDVANDNGPALARVDCPALGLTPADWRASDDGGRTWTRVVGADERWEPTVPPQFRPTWRDVVRLWPLLVLLIGIGTVALLRRPTGGGSSSRPRCTT